MNGSSLVADFMGSLRLSWRAKYPWFFGFSLLVLTLAVLLAAQFSGRQPATVALDVGLSIIRLLLPLILVLMVQELVSREFDRRYFLNSFAYPRARSYLLFGRFLAIILLTLGLLLVMALLLAVLVKLISMEYMQGTPVSLGFHYLLCIAFVGVDLLLLITFACMLAVFASTPGFVLIGTFGFMLVARSFAAIIDLLARDSSVVDNVEGYRMGVGLLGYLLPDLGALDIRMVALYGTMDFLPAEWPWLLFSSLAYIVALLSLAVLALHRKRFG